MDDHPQALRYLRDTLAGAGYDVSVAGEPQEVLRLVQRERLHLVLLDLALPGADGLELMQDILAWVNLPVIFLSGYGQDRVIAQAFLPGSVINPTRVPAVGNGVTSITPVSLTLGKASLPRSPTTGSLGMDRGRL